MLDTKEPLSTSLSDDPFSDDFQDPAAGGDGTDTATPLTPVVEPIVEQPAFGDLPFKSSDEIVKAYKDLQSSYANDRIRLHTLTDQLQQLTPLLRDMQIAKGATPHEAEEDVAASLAAFIQSGPNKTIASYLEKNLEKLIEPHIQPYKVELSQIKNERAIDKFLSGHPGLTREDELSLIDIVKNTPRINNSKGWSLEDKLEAAFERFVARDPSAYLARTVTPTAKVDSVADPNLAAAKGAAAIGSKGGSKGIQAPRDEMDEILDRERDERGRWK